MTTRKSQATRYDENTVIMDILDTKCPFLYDQLIDQSSPMILYHKYITHSDVVTRGKRTDKNQPYDNSILYYLSSDEMRTIERTSKQRFPTAKQSNITLPSEFYIDIGIEQLKRRRGKQNTHHSHINIAERHNVYLVNRSLKYFTSDYTKKVLCKLKKSFNWRDSELTYELDSGELTKLDSLHHAIHGIGTAKDDLFHKVRLNVFRNDSLYILIVRKNIKDIDMYIFLDKNPQFFSILGIRNKNWEDYQVRSDKILLSSINTEVLHQEQKNRSLQSKWKSLLAEEMINYSSKENEVFCPLTYISGDISYLSPLFIASHIKPFVECDAQEAYDLNNGLLLSANADALFDKYLITIDENKEIIFSFLIEHDALLQQKLLLNQDVFKLVLNEKRMEYMKHHRNRFFEIEKKRKTVQ